MALSPDERRFIKNWEEQRKGGKLSFIGVYTFGLFILLYMGIVAMGLFSGVAFVKVEWLGIAGIIALIGAISISLLLWRTQQKKFTKIVKREIAAGEAELKRQGEVK